METSNIYTVGATGEKICLEKGVLVACFTNASGGVFYYYISPADWMSYKSTHHDADFNFDLISKSIPGKHELVGGPFIVEVV